MYRHPTMFAGTFALLSVVGNLAAESPSVLLEKAIYAEESAGNINEAIRLYQQIVNDAQANRRYVAESGLWPCHKDNRLLTIDPRTGSPPTCVRGTLTPFWL